MRIPEISVSLLTVSETLLIWRRRNGFCQNKAAEVLGVTINHYKNLERGHKHDLSNLPKIEELEPNEICLILRKRAGLSIRKCAEKAGISRYWYNQMEQGKASPCRLIAHWGRDEQSDRLS